MVEAIPFCCPSGSLHRQGGDQEVQRRILRSDSMVDESLRVDGEASRWRCAKGTGEDDIED